MAGLQLRTRSMFEDEITSGMSSTGAARTSVLPVRPRTVRSGRRSASSRAEKGRRARRCAT
jgi:hypothetical protein